MNQERLTAKEKDEKYGPVFNLMIEARKAHAELTKANAALGGAQKSGASAETIAQLQPVADAAYQTAKAADEKVKQAQSGYTVDDVKLLLGYAGRAIIFDALTQDERGRNQWDSQKSRWLAKTLMSVIDDRSLPRADKDRVQRESLAHQRLRGIEAFIDLFETIKFTPNFGMNDRSVKDGLKRLSSLIQGLQGHERIQASELNKLYARVRTSVPRKWLEEREEQQKGFPIAEQLGSEQVSEIQSMTAEQPAPQQGKTRSQRKSR